MEPRISIVTAVYNNVEFIERCLDSVQAQDYPWVEHIVIDGDSTDGTKEVLENRRESLSYFVSEKDRGQTHALNKGFNQATGDILAWINADEEYVEGTLSKVAHAFTKVPDLDFFYGNRIVVDRVGRELSRRSWTPMSPRWHLLYRMTVLPTDASFWSARVHQLTGSLDDRTYPNISMDYDWLARMSVNVRRWSRSSAYLSRYTERPDRVTASADAGKVRENSEAIRRVVMQQLGIGKATLVGGWLAAGVWDRLYRGQVGWPHLGTSLRQALNPTNRD